MFSKYQGLLLFTKHNVRVVHDQLTWVHSQHWHVDLKISTVSTFKYLNIRDLHPWQCGQLDTLNDPPNWKRNGKFNILEDI